MIKVDDVTDAVAGASQILILDMRKVVNYTDYFVICHVANNKLTDPMLSAAINKLTSQGHIEPRIREKAVDKTWLLADYGSVILHVFSHEAREYYRLEKLWGQVPQQEVA